MAELVIRHGRLVDGSGAPARMADVVVDDGRIVAVDRARSRRPPPAPAGCSTPTGGSSRPGCVDVHTHYDAQATWDPLAHAQRRGTASRRW